MCGLDRWDDREIREGLNVVFVHHLGVFDAPPQVIDPAEQLPIMVLHTRRRIPMLWVATWNPAALTRSNLVRYSSSS